MYALDTNITRAYFRVREARRQRIWLERIWHPEKVSWTKRGAPPSIAEVTRIKYGELANLGFDEAFYQTMLATEVEAVDLLTDLAESHPLAPHFDLIKGLGMYLCGAFVAAGGDISRCPTVASFWKGMGLDLLPDGTVPRGIRGRRNVARTIACLPHVSEVGEQIRQQFARTPNSKLRDMYLSFRAKVDEKNPTRAKIFNYKDALRRTQKVLYSCLWHEWRESYALPAPDPYAFAILQHDKGGLIRIADFYDEDRLTKARISGQQNKGASQGKRAADQAGEPALVGNRIRGRARVQG